VSVCVGLTAVPQGMLLLSLRLSGVVRGRLVYSPTANALFATVCLQMIRQFHMQQLEMRALTEQVRVAGTWTAEQLGTRQTANSRVGTRCRCEGQCQGSGGYANSSAGSHRRRYLSKCTSSSHTHTQEAGSCDACS
jgi:hypothetical protein